PCLAYLAATEENSISPTPLRIGSPATPPRRHAVNASALVSPRGAPPRSLSFRQLEGISNGRAPHWDALQHDCARRVFPPRVDPVRLRKRGRGDLAPSMMPVSFRRGARC